jgi:hypothetical protein
MASTAMGGTRRRLPREARAERRRVDAVLECLPAVHAENRHLGAVGARERRIAIDVHFLHYHWDLPRHRVDDRPHVVAEVAIRTPVQRDPDLLTPHRPSSTERGFPRQDRRGLFT